MDLPVRPLQYCGDAIHTAYINEFKKVYDAKTLKEFTKKWRNIFLIKVSNEEKYCILSKEEEQIVTGKYSAREVIDCIKKNANNEPCKHIEKMQKEKEGGEEKTNSCVAMNLMMPFTMIFVSMLSENFRVPTDVVWIKLAKIIFPELSKKIDEYVYG